MTNDQGLRTTDQGLHSYDDYAVVQNASYYYWVRAKTATQISRMSYVGMGYAGLNPDQMEGEADLAVSDMVFLPVNMRPDTSAGTVSLRLKNLGPDALNAAEVDFDFYMGAAGENMLWIGGDSQSFTLAAGAEELVILTPQARRGIVARGDLPLDSALTTRVRVRHLTELRDPNPANNVTDAAGRVRVRSSGVNSRGRGLTDYDGDGKSDMGLLRTDRTAFVFLNSGARFYGMHWTGMTLDPGLYHSALGDYDGDGVLDLGLYDEQAGVWYVQYSATGLIAVMRAFGPGWKPVPGDYDGDGKTDPVLYHEATATWTGWLSASGYAMATTQTGGPGYAPVPGDYDGDGWADPVAFSSAAGRWVGRLSGQNYADAELYLGLTGWQGLTGDFDGDGLSDPAVYLESTGQWLVLMSTDGQGYVPAQGILGGPGWTPALGDYDGDGKADLMVYNPLAGDVGLWRARLSTCDYAEFECEFGGPGYDAASE